MKALAAPPRILVIDDVYGRRVRGVNDDRLALCLQLQLEDVTDGGSSDVTVRQPIAEAVFCRGQRPVFATVGDIVENDLAGTLDLIDSGWHGRPFSSAPWALVLLDLRFRSGRVTAESEARFGEGSPEGSEDDSSASTFFGLRLLEEIQRRYPQLPVVVLSDAPRETVSQRSTSLGAVAFLSKGHAFASEKLAEYLRHHALIPDPAGEIVGNSISLLVALRNARRAAVGSESVLIRGETGTGKELLARYVHRNDPARASGPLVIVDSGTLTPELYASELFGHMRGSFTSAFSDRQGSIVEANHGILFLDEIGNINHAVQRGLLRVLQEKQVRPVGGSRSREIDVRFIFATNEDIETRAALEDGFRLDLLERIRQGGTVVLPPLRERLDDLPALTEALLREAERLTPRATRRRIDPRVLDAIAEHSWPGNVRQLRSSMIAAVRARPDVEHLDPVHFDFPGTEARPAVPARVDAEVRRADIEEIIGLIESADPAACATRQLVGSYAELETAFARLSMKYLRACLNATRKPSVRNPAGEVLVQPAVKLMLGETNVSASRAYDFVIRLRNLSAIVAGEWDSDDLLQPLFERARRQRRTGRRHLRADEERETRHG